MAYVIGETIASKDSPVGASADKISSGRAGKIYGRVLAFAEGKSMMRRGSRGCVLSENIADGVDPIDQRQRGSRIIDRRELSVAHHESVRAFGGAARADR